MAKQINAVLKLKDNFSPEMEKAAKKVMKSSAKMSYSLRKTGTGITKFGQSLTNKITKPALGVATALGAVALKKGWERMIGIDSARAKLLALGNSTKDVNLIMDNALESVKGTAFGLDAAATTAAAAVASGIKPGRDLQKYLSGIADTAAIAGTGMDEMGSIFNKVAAGGKAQSEELNQLMDRGIPIMAWLQKSTGKTAEEVKAMASAGQIDLKTFRKAVEDNVGGAAKKIGSSTIKAALDNTGAALGRLGAAFLGGSDDKKSFAGQLLKTLNKLQGFFDKMQPQAEAFGQKFGQAFTWICEKVQLAYQMFMKLSPTTRKVLLGVVLGAGPAITIFGKLVTAVGTGIRVFNNIKKAVNTMKFIFTAFSFGPLVAVVAGFVAVVTIVVIVIKNFKKIKAWFKNVANACPSIQGAVNAVKGAFSSLKEAIGGAIDKLKTFFGYDGKTVHVSTSVSGSIPAGKPGSSHPITPHNATGTSYFRGGPTTVNEGGRGELITLPSGAKILPADKTKAALSGSSNVTVNLTVQGNVIGNREFMESCGNYIAGRIMSAMCNV